MCDYPIHTKLSDLMSSDDELPEDEPVKVQSRIKLNFTESSSKAIRYRENLHTKADNLTEGKASDFHASNSKSNRDRDLSVDFDSAEEGSSPDLNFNKRTRCTAGSEVNTEENPCQKLEQSDGNMSKRFGLLFQKGVRTKTEKVNEQAPASQGTDKETVLPHLKSAKPKPEYAESSFIEVKENHFTKQDNLEPPKQGQSASTSASDDSELGTRADPIGESCDANMATAVSESRVTDDNKSKKCDEKELENTKTSGVESTRQSEQSNSVETADNLTRKDAASEASQQNGEKLFDDNMDSIDTNHASSASAKDNTRTDSTPGASNEDEKKKGSSTKSIEKKDPIGARATRSSLLRSKSTSQTDPSARKGRPESISSDESERIYRPVAPPPPKDPVPDGSSDFKPYEHWQSVKDTQKSDAKSKVAAKREFSEKYRKHGLPKKTPSVGDQNTPKHHQSLISLASNVASEHASKSILKPEFNPFGSPSDKYLTPLQQKEKMIRDLQTYVTKLEETVNLQADDIANFQEEKEEALQYLADEKDTEIDEIYQEVKKLEDEKDDIIDQLKKTEAALEEEKEVVGSLHGKMAQMEIEREEREEKHKRNYFERYQKGREAQLIEQEEDLVCHAMLNPGNAPNKQLVHRLEKTEKQLDTLRQTFRNEMYKQAPQLESNSEAQVELLKSAVFYYLTDCQADTNLRTMLSMLNYSEVQKKNIIRHLEKKKK